MIEVLIIFAVGIIIGVFLRKRKMALKIVDKFINVAIYLLLFLLGISVGGNQQIVRNFHEIGYYSLMVAVAGVLGSIIMAFFVYKLFYSKNES